MATLAEIRRRSKAQVSSVGIGSDEKFSGFFFESMRDMVQKITEAALQDILSNQDVLNALVEKAAMVVLANIDVPADGKPGKPGKKGDKGDSVKGADGKTPKKGVDYFTKADKEEMLRELKKAFAPVDDVSLGDRDPDEELERQAMISAILAQLNISGEDLVKAINNLPVDPAKQIDAKHIKNLPKAQKGAAGGTELFRGGLKLVWNTLLEGTVDGANTVFTIPPGLPDPKDSRYIVSARGVLKDEDSGDFTVSNNNRTITFTDAPPNGSAQPRIPLYHGK